MIYGSHRIIFFGAKFNLWIIKNHNFKFKIFCQNWHHKNLDKKNLLWFFQSKFFEEETLEEDEGIQTFKISFFENVMVSFYDDLKI